MYREVHPGHLAFCGPAYVLAEERECLKDRRSMRHFASANLGYPPDPNNPYQAVDRAIELHRRAIRWLRVDRRFIEMTPMLRRYFCRTPGCTHDATRWVSGVAMGGENGVVLEPMQVR